MSLATYLRARTAPVRPYLLLALAAGVGLVAGLGLTWPYRDPHTTTAEPLRGTVIWSNAEDRTFAFEADGEVRGPRDEDTIYHVVSDEANYPGCLAGKADDPVRRDRRHVKIYAMHERFEGPQTANFAVSVRCLD